MRSDHVLANLKNFNPEAVRVTDFSRSLKAARNTFYKRRYLFESTSEEEWFYAHLLREAIGKVTGMDIRLVALR